MSLLTIPTILEQKSKIIELPERFWRQPSEASTKSKAENFSSDLHKSFLFQELVLKVLGRFPFNYHSNNLFAYYCKAIFHWFYFGITSLFVLFILGLSTFGFAEFYLNWHFPIKIETNSTIHQTELKHFNQNLVPFVLLWGCMAHVTVGNISFIANRKKVACYIELWKETVDQLCIPIPVSIRRFLVKSNMWIMVFISSVLFCFYHKQLFTTVSGIAKLMILLTFRLLLRPGLALETIQSSDCDFYPTVSLIGVIYIIYASRALVFMYTFFCRLLRHCFRTWNERFMKEMTTCRPCKGSENLKIETEICQTLFKQYVILIEMVQKTDIVFAANLESYYLTQVLNMCFELYYLAMSGTCVFGTDILDNKNLQGQGVIIAVLLIIQTFVIFFTVSLEATYVSDEAMKGFQFLRKRGIHLNDSLEKKSLVQNLLIIYSQTIVLTGGKFFSIDRPFIIRVLGAVFTYFVIILQFGSQTEDECG